MYRLLVNPRSRNHFSAADSDHVIRVIQSRRRPSRNLHDHESRELAMRARANGTAAGGEARQRPD
jgi:hypothetical protein